MIQEAQRILMPLLQSTDHFQESSTRNVPNAWEINIFSPALRVSYLCILCLNFSWTECVSKLIILLERIIIFQSQFLFSLELDDDEEENLCKMISLFIRCWKLSKAHVNFMKILINTFNCLLALRPTLLYWLIQVVFPIKFSSRKTWNSWVKGPVTN